MADGVGFEPTRSYEPLPVFKTGAFDHSATHPRSYLAKDTGGVSRIYGANHFRPNQRFEQ